MRRGQPAGHWQAEHAAIDAAMSAAAPGGAPATTALAAGRSVADLEVAILTTVQSALTASGGALDVDTPAQRAHTLTQGFMDLGLDSHDATVVIQRLNMELVGADGGEQLSSSSFLEYPTPAQLAQHLHERFSTSADGLVGGAIAPRILSIGKSSRRVAVAAVEGRLPGKAHSPEVVEQLMASAVDMIGELALNRWPNTPLTDANVGENVRFGGVLDGAELVDAARFGVTVAEASAMDPQQRMLLESGYAALHAGGLARSALMGADTAVHIGLMNSDFADRPASGSVYAATGARPSVAAGRISFVLGMQGPCTTIDTACSSALAAVDFAQLHLLTAHASSALAFAVNVILTPSTSVSFARAGMLSHDGRCKTFDSRANGYVRAEGVGGLVLTAVPSGTGVALELASNVVRQDGLSASLTAPNGVAQSRLLGAAISEAALEPSELKLIEPHGTGTPLGDPTEIRSLVRASSTMSPAIYGIKANIGHLEPAAGSAGLIVLAASLRTGQVGACAQLRAMNPKIVDAVVAGAKLAFPAQPTAAIRSDVTDVTAAAAGVSSFGFSGTIAHTVMRARPDAPAHPAPTHPLVLRSRAFPWRSSSSSLLGVPTSVTDEGACFLAPAGGPLVAIVADHLVQKKIVFPGAGYLEVARAAAVHDAPGGGQAGSLTQAVFLAPLFVDDAPSLFMEVHVRPSTLPLATWHALHTPPPWHHASPIGATYHAHSSPILPPAATCTCQVSLFDNEQLEIRSGLWDGAALLEPTLHAMVHRATPAAVPAKAAGGIARSRLVAGSALDRAPLFAALAKSGLMYGPDYRRLGQLWACSKYESALSSLLVRTDRQGTQTHPADLDAALQLQQVAVLARGLKGPSRETALPFAIDEASLFGGGGKMRAASVDAGSMHNLMLTRGTGCEVVAQLLGVKTKMAKLGPQLGGGEKQTAYTVVWKRRVADAPTRPTGKILLLGSAHTSLQATVGLDEMTTEIEQLFEIAAEPPRALSGIVIDATAVSSHLERTDSLNAIFDAFVLLQGISPTRSDGAAIWLLATRSLPVPSSLPLPSSDMHAAERAGVWGLVRCARAEMPTTRLGCIERASPLSTNLLTSASLSLLPTDPNLADEPELVSSVNEWKLPQLVRPPVFHDGLIKMVLSGTGSIANMSLEPMALDDLVLPDRERGYALDVAVQVRHPTVTSPSLTRLDLTRPHLTSPSADLTSSD